MSFASSLRQLWVGLSKPRVGLIPSLLRRRSVRRRIAHGPEPLVTERDFDRAVRDYLTIWLSADSQASHNESARLYFDLDEDEAHFVDQVLIGAARGTLRNWMNCHDDPWFQAAWRLSQAYDRAYLHELRWRIKIAERAGS